VAKTTTAIHLAAYLHQREPTLLVDAAPTQSALAWAAIGHLPFEVVSMRRAIRYARENPHTHMIFDTDAQPQEKAVKELVEECDLLIIPTLAQMLSVKGLLLTADAIAKTGMIDKVRALLTMVPARCPEEEDARGAIKDAGLQMFDTCVPHLKAFQLAALAGAPVYDISYPRADVAWEAYQKLGREVLRNGS